MNRFATGNPGLFLLRKEHAMKLFSLMPYLAVTILLLVFVPLAVAGQPGYKKPVQSGPS